MKQAFNLSDEALVERWVENPYWQYFCGEVYLRHDFLISTKARFGFKTKLQTLKQTRFISSLWLRQSKSI